MTRAFSRSSSNEESTSAMATENKQQRFTIEKSKFAFTKKSRHFREKS
jgi:hypothetical protein